MDGEIAGRLFRAALCADGRSRAADHRMEGAAPGGIVRRLPLHERLAGLQAAEHVGRELAAGVALDAGLVDEQLAGEVLGHCQLAPRHAPVVTAGLPPRAVLR